MPFSDEQIQEYRQAQKNRFRAQNSSRNTSLHFDVQRREYIMQKHATNLVKLVLPKALTVNYERAMGDGLLLIFTPKHAIMSAKQLLSKLTTASLLAAKVIP